MSEKPNPSAQPNQPWVAPVVERNIRTLLARRQAEEAKLGWQEKVATAITRFSGSMAFVYLHLVVYGLWIVINVVGIPGLPRFDPSLVLLAMAASVEAIFLSTFILITQNRMMAQADRRADLNLQISLLAEHEITRLITMTQSMARKMGLAEAESPELEQLGHDVSPEQVLETIDKNEQSLRQGNVPP
jgi:uncharacterized membrane protein